MKSFQNSETPSLLRIYMYGEFKVLLYLILQEDTDKTLHIFEFQAKFQKNTFKRFFEFQTSLNFQNLENTGSMRCFWNPHVFQFFVQTRKHGSFLLIFTFFFMANFWGIPV